MPISDRRFDDQIKEFLAAHPFERYFDIGCGVGKYGKMVKQLYPQATVIGIEADNEYIQQYEVSKVYDQVINDRIETFIKQNPAFTTDVAILGDLLEHLYKSDGLDLLHYLMYRTKYIICVFPSKFVMFDFRGHPTEAHNSVWTESDFSQFEYEYFQKDIMNLVIIKGYWSDPTTVYNLDKH